MEKEELSFSQDDFACLKKAMQKYNIIGRVSLGIGVIGTLLLLIDKAGIYPILAFDKGYTIFIVTIVTMMVFYIRVYFQNKKYQQDMREGIKIKRVTNIRFKKSLNNDLEIAFDIFDDNISDLDVSQKIFDLVQKKDECTIEYARHSKYLLSAHRNSDTLNLLS